VFARRAFLVACCVTTLACSPGAEKDGTSTRPDGGGGDASIADGGFDPDSGFGFDAEDDTASASDGRSDGGVFNDAVPDVTGTTCLETGTKPGPGPITRTCAPPTDNECDGKSETNAALPNGLYGNGFDDDCDGIVDEGCACDAAHPPGTTKECWLVPASQVDPTTKKPVGWCAPNAKGTTACVKVGTGELGGKTWDGFCKGAQPPFKDDVCAPGDFDCDGAAVNPKAEDCACKPVTVTCPTDPFVISPYPERTNLEKKKPNPYDPKPADPFIIDGWKWIGGDATKSTGWKWTVTGGDCDNILPHPTFAVFAGADATKAPRLGTETSGLGTDKKQKGFVVPPGTNHQVWPAFALSGDYVVQGEFDLYGKHYTCTQKVQVRAPGLRAEMCWDIRPGDPIFGLSTTDADLHLARLQGTTCTGKHGWFDTCGTAPASDDCYYKCDSGCRTKNAGFCAGIAPAPGWGYAASDTAVCHGWGSLREAGQTCDNPRLDRDNLGCNPKVVDPNATGAFDSPLSNFCGPENINLDNPNAADKFLVGVHFYGGDKVKPHVNIYCNGERKLSLGYNPTTTPATTNPQMTLAHNPSDTDKLVDGDFWSAAMITWSGGTDPCVIEPVPSKTPKTDKDGSTSYCVDTNAQNKTAPTTSDLWLFTPGGGYPSTAAAACWH